MSASTDLADTLLADKMRAKEEGDDIAGILAETRAELDRQIRWSKIAMAEEASLRSRLSAAKRENAGLRDVIYRLRETVKGLRDGKAAK